MRQKIAVVGSGISGLGAAWLLNRKNEVHLFDKRTRLGGHTYTVKHRHQRQGLALDTGFIVFNEQTYPTLTKAFSLLGIATQPSDMSFAVSCRTPDLEYGGSSLQALFAQPRNALRPSYLRMLKDIWRFGRVGREALENRPDPSVTIGEFLRDEQFGDAFASYFLLPMTAAIWSTAAAQRRCRISSAICPWSVTARRLTTCGSCPTPATSVMACRLMNGPPPTTAIIVP